MAFFVKKSYAQVVAPRLPRLREMAAKGATEKEIADELGISPASLSAYRRHNHELNELLCADAQLQARLHQAILRRAMGYVTTEEVLECKEGEGLTVKKRVVKESPPDLAAVKLLLKQPEGKEDCSLEEARKLLELYEE